METVPVEAKWVLSIISGFFLIFGFLAFSGSWVTGVWHTRNTITGFLDLEGIGAKIVGTLLILMGVSGLVWIWFFL